jgi:hypothetical protein
LGKKEKPRYAAHKVDRSLSQRGRRQDSAIASVILDANNKFVVVLEVT